MFFCEQLRTTYFISQSIDILVIRCFHVITGHLFAGYSTRLQRAFSRRQRTSQHIFHTNCREYATTDQVMTVS